MKRIISILAFVLVTFFSVAQSSYQPFQVQNKAIVTEQELIYEKGDSMIVLVEIGTSEVYVLENMTTPNYIAPTLPPNWSTTILYKQHRTVYHFNIGDQYRVVNDNNGYSYLELH